MNLKEGSNPNPDTPEIPNPRNLINQHESNERMEE